MSVCNIICFYNGRRRNNQERFFEKYISLQTECLNKVSHSLDKIIFVISDDTITETRTEEKDGITYFYRPNINYSFGGWVDAMFYFPNFDYYILQEDDYFFIKDNYDKILIEQYIQRQCDYLVTWREIDPPSGNPLTSTIGIISRETFEKYNFSNFNQTNIGIRAMATFLFRFNNISGLDYKYNLFPYYDNDIIYYGYNHDKSKEENYERILLCCYQFYIK